MRECMHARRSVGREAGMKACMDVGLNGFIY